MPILPLAFTLGADEDPVLAPVVVDQRYALIDVTEIARSAPQPLASIREQVSQDFMLDRSARRARTIATEIAEKVNGGMTLSAALAEAGVTLPAPQPARATRRAISQAQNVPEPIRLLFRMAANTAKLVRLPSNQGWFVVVLESIASDPDEITPELIEATRSQFASVTANEYAEQFINAVLADYPVTRNEDAITALRERLTSGRSN
jgi:peptidyl-prolyl cis-trans isomerase D